MRNGHSFFCFFFWDPNPEMWRCWSDPSRDLGKRFERIETNRFQKDHDETSNKFLLEGWPRILHFHLPPPAVKVFQPTIPLLDEVNTFFCESTQCVAPNGSGSDSTGNTVMLSEVAIAPMRLTSTNGCKIPALGIRLFHQYPIIKTWYDCHINQSFNDSIVKTSTVEIPILNPLNPTISARKCNSSDISWDRGWIELDSIELV